MIQLIALDLDGTTLKSGSILSDNTKQVIEEAIRRGAHVVAASGRSYHSFPPVMWEVKGLEYGIGSNGSAIYRLDTGEKLWHNILDTDRVLEIMEVLGRYKEVKLALEAFVDGRGYADRLLIEEPKHYGIASDSGAAYIRSTREPVDDMYQFIVDHRHELDAIDMLIPEVEKKLEIQDALGEVEGVYVTTSQVYMIELVHKDSGKGAAVRWLTEYLGIDPSEVMACGNAENDIDMITFAGIGVAVANAEESVKAAADYMTDDHNHEGVAKAIEKFVLAEKE